MAKILDMPALSPTMVEGVLISWLVPLGTQVNIGDVIAEVETDKATMEVEAPYEGILTHYFNEVSRNKIKVGQPLALLSQKGDLPEDIEKMKQKYSSRSTIISEIELTSDSHQSNNKESLPSFVPNPIFIESTPSTPSDSFLKKGSISPVAARLARQQGIPVHKLEGSGPHHRIIKRDVELAISQGYIDNLAQKSRDIHPQSTQTLSHLELFSGFEPDFKNIPITSREETIAKRLTYSKTHIPHYYLTRTCCVEHLMLLRTRMNEKLLPEKLSVNDWIIKACALALHQVPVFNTAWADTEIRHYSSVNLAIAVSIPPNTLITPVLRDAHTKGILSLSRELKNLVQKAKEGTLPPSAWQGGTFTLSNLGMYGIETFQAILNPPQSGILAIGKVHDTAQKGDNGSVVWKPTLNLTLSADHRVVNGAQAAEFFTVLIQFLEHPEDMLL
jgi:pyruvate dehydrogenase E2 component (dihydrolipoamide acetyltransferase)